MLHGHASNARAASDLAAEIDPDHRFVHVAPDGPVDFGAGDFAWFDDTPGSLAACRTTIRSLLDGLSADGGGGPIVVVGYSQGAAAAIVGLSDPDATPFAGVAGLAVVSGFVAEQPGVDQDLGRLSGLPVLVQHGRRDDVVPAFFAEDLATALGAAGAVVGTDWRDDMGHERTPGSVAALGDWARPLAETEV